MKVRLFQIRNISIKCLILATIGIVFLPLMINARVVRVEINNREIVAASPESGITNSYEIITGIFYLEVDPNNPANQLITDLEFAERNSRGNIEFSSEFELHKPVRPELGNHRLLHFVNNRGDKIGERHFNCQSGTNWLYSKGWSYLWCGWNCDVIQSDKKLNINVPVVHDNGQTIAGKVYSELTNYASNPVYCMPIVWGGSIAYPPLSIDDPTAHLTKRRYREDQPIDVPRDSWAFARIEGDQLVSDTGYLFIQEGFEPGWLYDLVYTAKNPKVTGLGMAAIRDVISFFKYQENDDNGFANPLAANVEHAYAWGHSQSARLLTHFLYQNFNGDEENRMVFDGIMSNCGGAGKGLFNSRFAQTTRHGSHHEDNLYPVDIFPFNTVEQYDPVTGEHGDVLEISRQVGLLPKVFFINSSTDYWTRGASLLHTDVEGKQDAGIDPNVRIYTIAARAHGDSRIGIIGRALLTALDQWASFNIEPPESQIPRISDGSLVDLEHYLDSFPAIPETQLPNSYYHPYRLNPGPRWRTMGIADSVPPIVGPRYVCLVPQVNSDGTEIGGIHLPEAAVPLATYAGWNLRSSPFSNTLRRNTGNVWPFPMTLEERLQEGDPRSSIEERYPTTADYVSEVSNHLLELHRQRLLLDEDLVSLLRQANLQAELLDARRNGKLRFFDEIATEAGADAALDHFLKIQDAEVVWFFGLTWSEFISKINTRGYELMFEGDFETAFEVFRTNTLIFYRNWNVWDSMAECCYKMGKYDLAKEHYEKSLALNPGNTNAEKMLEELSTLQPIENQ